MVADVGKLTMKYQCCKYDSNVAMKFLSRTKSKYDINYRSYFRKFQRRNWWPSELNSYWIRERQVALTVALDWLSVSIKSAYSRVRSIEVPRTHCEKHSAQEICQFHPDRRRCHTVCRGRFRDLRRSSSHCMQCHARLSTSEVPNEIELLLLLYELLWLLYELLLQLSYSTPSIATIFTDEKSWTTRCRAAPLECFEKNHFLIILK